MNVVFDFGAVLFHWQPSQILAAYFPDRTATPEATRALTHGLFGHPDWHGFDQGTVTLDEVVSRSAERLDVSRDTLHAMVSGIGDRLEPITESVALLQRLHALRATRPELRLYYLSNMPVPFGRVLEQRHAFLNWFDGGIFSGDVKLIKPQPEIYQLLQTRYDLNPTQTVFIDDLKTNVKAAQQEGWHAIHFESTAQVAAELAALGL